jgi:hypothetical protein
MEHHSFGTPVLVTDGDDPGAIADQVRSPDSATSKGSPSFGRLTWRVPVYRKSGTNNEQGDNTAGDSGSNLILVDTLYIDDTNLPPRRSSTARKIVWQLPKDPDKAPSFGYWEQQRLYELYKQRKKERRRKLKEGEQQEDEDNCPALESNSVLETSTSDISETPPVRTGFSYGKKWKEKQRKQQAEASATCQPPQSAPMEHAEQDSSHQTDSTSSSSSEVGPTVTEHPSPAPQSEISSSPQNKVVSPPPGFQSVPATMSSASPSAMSHERAMPVLHYSPRYFAHHLVPGASMQQQHQLFAARVLSQFLACVSQFPNTAEIDEQQRHAAILEWLGYYCHNHEQASTLASSMHNSIKTCVVGQAQVMAVTLHEKYVQLLSLLQTTCHWQLHSVVVQPIPTTTESVDTGPWLLVIGSGQTSKQHITATEELLSFTLTLVMQPARNGDARLMEELDTSPSKCYYQITNDVLRLVPQHRQQDY